jgi:hypothetical protein
MTAAVAWAGANEPGGGVVAVGGAGGMVAFGVVAVTYGLVNWFGVVVDFGVAAEDTREAYGLLTVAGVLVAACATPAGTLDGTAGICGDPAQLLNEPLCTLCAPLGKPTVATLPATA